ncbi:MAG: ABC transporter ATP-binding protein [Rhodobacter sp.]|uniref:ABC transporter ATP-binding protein n=1 Tax=Pararhodobacter sp. TaxID=2127056 RepID=UPI001DFA8CBC|nr:ABC transporter ATP-binding protein [Pararhodobacter sp.]MCB1343856.1 ABC transporter ATP-binding protein [Paracoccaceae bacterium]MCC0073414.1 ABC transporter ATP-binding protein [Rhodobacter sp.]HPD92270.1 ABC transporter ATP-binding protein [Pararhodobacter sp.]
MAEPVLTLSHLSKSFGALRATDDVSLTLEPGEIHALIGPNGAGKSTLIGQIAGRLAPDSGTIAFRGRDVTRLSTAQRARMGLGRTFQISSLIPEFSARRNVMLALQARQGHPFRFLKPVQRDKGLIAGAQSILARVGLDGRASVPSAELSHGERRLLEIAVALALEPACFLLDEPMAGMGAEGVGTLVQFLRALKQQAPILLVEHDMDAVFALADRISVLVYGRVIATGSVDQIRNDPQVREAYLGEETP